MGCSRKNPHTPDGWDSGNSRGRGVNDSGNPGGTGGWTWKSLLLGSFWPIVHAIRMFSSMSLQHSQTLKIVEIFCSHISHIP